MEILFAFAGGLVLAALVATLVAVRVVRKSSERSARTARLEAEAEFGSQRSRLQSELEHAQESLREQQKRSEDALAERDAVHAQALDALQKRFDETVSKVSAQLRSETGEMLKARQKEFSESSGQSIGQIVNPLKENIAELRKAMEQSSKDQASAQGEMRERIRSLMEHSDAARRSADELAAAFKHGSKVQGDWGETILEELLSSQSLTKGIHYDTQEVICGSDGKPVHTETGAILRPDVILHLDERREVIIDSKVSLTAYVDYVNAEDEASRREALKAHLESLRKHVKELSDKDYASYIRPPKVSVGYVIMFVPNIGALWTALDAEPDLWRKAADKNVYIADEQSLYGALKIVNLTWTQLAQARDHEKVYDLAGEMIDRVGQFMERYEAVGKALDRAQTEYEAGLRKLSPQGQSIINTSGKLLRLGARQSDRHPVKALLDIDELPAIEAPGQDKSPQE